MTVHRLHPHLSKPMTFAPMPFLYPHTRPSLCRTLSQPSFIFIAPSRHLCKPMTVAPMPFVLPSHPTLSLWNPIAVSQPSPINTTVVGPPTPSAQRPFSRKPS
ncbi:hypothetical protein HN51_036180 [Arachis hypogaea]